MRQGHIKLARKLFESEDWGEPRTFSRFEAWVDFIQMAAWKEHTRGGETVGRGELCISLRFLADRWGWSVKRVRDCLARWAGNEGTARAQQGTRIRAQREAQRGTVYLIVNYDAYQSTPRHEGTAKGTAKGTASSRKGHKEECSRSSKAVKPSLAADAVSGDGARPTTWLTPVSAVWESRMGEGTFPWPIAGRALKPLSEHHEGGEIAAHLGEYLDATRPEFVNLHKFSQTFAKWKPEPLIDPTTGWFTPKAQAWYDSLPKS